MAEQIKFISFFRNQAATGATPLDGRLLANLPLTLAETNGARAVTQPVEFLLMGPGDVRGLKPGAVRRTFPANGAINVETDKCPYAEFAATDLPWRYSPDPNMPMMRPWLLLIVGAGEEITQLPGERVVLSQGLINEYGDIGLSAKLHLWAHAQEYPGRAVCRLLSPRGLQPGRGYVAALVPAFNANGQLSLPAGSPIPCFYSWRFTTSAEKGSFVDLADRLFPLDPIPPNIGLAPVAYQSAANQHTLQPEMLVGGALVGLDVDPPSALPAEVAAHFASIRPLAGAQFHTDGDGRPLVRMPLFGEPWLPAGEEEPLWMQALNDDPRLRGIAGLGMWAGIVWQDRIVDAAASQLGALHQASRRIRQLNAGLAASRSLWDRRLPAEESQRLQLLGPALGRMATTGGRSALDYAAGPGRALPAGVFSSAARRLLRPGTARTRLAQPGALAPAALLERLNTCPPDSREHPDGLIYAGPLCAGQLDQAIEDLVAHGGEVDLTGTAQEDAGQLHLLEEQEWAEMGVPHGFDDTFSGFIMALNELPDSRQGLGRAAHTPYPTRLCEKHTTNLGRLSAVLHSELSPHGDSAFVIRRVLATITGLDDQPLTPPELCLDFHIPAWKFLNEFAREWLLPGLGELHIKKVDAAGGQIPDPGKDPVLAVETNGLFSDAFLVGFNQQALAELRWRNIPVVAGCTPLRRFWEPLRPLPPAGDGEAGEDIKGIHSWGKATPLGDAQHETPEAQDDNLVLIFKSQLWRRYPETLIYLLPQTGNGEPDWTAAHILPNLHVEIGRDAVAFGFAQNRIILNTHWVVIEQVLRDVNFYNLSKPEGTQAMAQNSSALFAEKAFARPVRVLIRGTELVPQEP